MDRGESDGVGNVLLAQRKRVALFADHVAGGDALHQMQKQMGNAFFGRELAQCGNKLVRVVSLGYEKARYGRLNVGIGRELLADLGTRESAYADFRQRLDRAMERVFEDGDGGQDISRQQELQNLPAAIGKLKISVGPARTDNEYLAGDLIPDGELRACAGRSKVLPVGAPV